MKITRKGYYTITGPGGLLTKPDGSTRQSTNRDDCYEYITQDAENQENVFDPESWDPESFDFDSLSPEAFVYRIHPPEYEVVATITVHGDTIRVSDYDPIQFTFIDVIDVLTSTEQISNEVQILGINTASPISVTGGGYNIDDTGWTTLPGFISPGSMVKVRHDSSDTSGMDTDTTLTIYGVSGTFTSTTIASATSYDDYYARVPFAIEQPTAPVITQPEVNITTTGSQAGTDIQNALATPGTKVIVPNSAGNVGSLWLGGVTDCELEMGLSVVVSQIVMGRTSGAVDDPTVRMKVTGGNIGYLRLYYDCTDIIMDGCIFENDQGFGVSGQTEMFRFANSSASSYLNRFLVINSMCKLFADPQASFNLGAFARNVMWANSNFSNSGNTVNAWGWRLGGATNWAWLDCAALVASHKMVRTDSDPVTNLFIDGGTWMREDSTNPDAWAQIINSPVTGVTIQNLDCWFAESGTDAIRVGFGSGSNNGTWTMRDINFYATNSSVVSNAVLNSAEGAAGSGTPDYGGSSGTHTYTYNVPTTLPNDQWRNLPDLPNNGNPEALSYP